MVRQHYYHRRYHYKDYKRAVDGQHAVNSLIVLAIGGLAWTRFASVGVGLVAGFITLVFLSIIGGAIERQLATFWGEQGVGCLPLLLLRMLKWAAVLAAAIALTATG